MTARGASLRPRPLSPAEIAAFQTAVWTFYQRKSRSMPWRDDYRPYYVLVSEMMLQQTQVARVMPKFQAFIRQFPSVDALAAAPLAAVLQGWSGLGYNRRAKFLHQTARIIVAEHSGRIPSSPLALARLPGIGLSTAGAIAAYAYDRPVLYLETNIRTVLLQHFFAGTAQATDAALLQIAGQVMDLSRPRQWYWAVMDYGADMKQRGDNQVRRSTTYRRQSPLKGSLREVRGSILKLLVAEGPTDIQRLRSAWSSDRRLKPALESLQIDGLIERQGTSVRLTAQA